MKIHLELDDDQNLALAKAISYRHKYLETQPPSPERDEEMRALASIAQQANAQSKQRAHHLGRMIKEFEE